MNMPWRKWLGLTPTEADLAGELIRASAQGGVAAWVYDPADSTLRQGGRIVNLANLYFEYVTESIIQTLEANFIWPRPAGSVRGLLACQLASFAW
jgi:hypothetical protein